MRIGDVGGGVAGRRLNGWALQEIKKESRDFRRKFPDGCAALMVVVMVFMGIPTGADAVAGFGE